MGLMNKKRKIGFMALGLFLLCSGIFFAIFKVLQDRDIYIFSDCHPLIKKALEEEMAFRVATGQNIQEILNLIKVIYSQNPSIDKKKLKKDILNRMKTDLELFAILNKTIRTHPEGIVVPFPLSNHQMITAIKGAQPLIESDLDTLLEGNVPQGYDYQSSNLTHLVSNQENIYGDSKGTFLKTALFNIFLQLTNQTQTLNFNEMKRIWSETSPSFDKVPLPQNVGYSQFAQIDERFSTFPYFLEGNDDWKSGFLFYPHSGFSFGGSRYHPHPKLYGPEDCTSWVGKLTESPYAITTVDFLYAHRYYLPEEGAYVPEEWPTSSIGIYLKRFKPVPISNPSQDIKPGMIYVEKTFFDDDPTMKNTFGFGGHAALVLNVSKDGKHMDILGYARIMPEFEGFGITNISVESIYPRKVMFFSVQ